MRETMNKLFIASLLLIASTVAVLAQAPQQASVTQLQDYIRVLQSDRQSAQQQIDQLRLNLLAAQEKSQELDAYWKSYVAGLSPKSEK